MGTEKLFDMFSEVSPESWSEKIRQDFSRDFINDALHWVSPEGIKVKPFYHADEIRETTRATTNIGTTWKVGHSIHVPDGNNANAGTYSNSKALDFLERGAESLQFVVPTEKTAIEELLQGIDLAAVPVYLNLKFLSKGYLRSLADFTKHQGAKLYLNIDILGNLAETGNWFFNQKKDHDILNMALDIGLPNMVSVDMGLYQNAGANMVQQLAFAMAHATEYFNLLYTRNDSGPRQNFTFKVAVGSNFFFEIAKIRALRLLFHSLVSDFDLKLDCHIVAVPTQYNKTIYDYNVNLLRTTSECMAGILGGADTLFNLRYDALYHEDNEFGERIALNQLLLLKNESHFDKVHNPPDGSYYIETLTHQLATKALSLFKAIEREGGFLKHLKDNGIQKKIEATFKTEQVNFNSGREVLVGSNRYQNSKDKMWGNLEIDPFAAPKHGKTLIQPIARKRLAAPMEKERLKNE